MRKLLSAIGGALGGVLLVDLYAEWSTVVTGSPLAMSLPFVTSDVSLKSPPSYNDTKAAGSRFIAKAIVAVAVKMVFVIEKIVFVL